MSDGRIDSPEALGQVLRSARRRRGLTQQELADNLGASCDWVERGGAPRAELLLILRALASVGLTVSVEDVTVAPDLEAVVWQNEADLPGPPRLATASPST